MKYFIFRNNTCENLFGSKDICYSGYDDISFVPDNFETYVWFYMLPFKSKEDIIADELSVYLNKLEIIYPKVPIHRILIIFSINKIFPFKFIDSNNTLNDSIVKYNQTINNFALKYENIRIVDFNEFTSKYSIDSLIDWKYYFISKMQLSPKVGRDFNEWFISKIRSIELKRKKCLILDLDNTLWGGVIGEDGIEGIRIGGDYPGNAFLFFQESLVELSKNGIILAICSKNNENDVLEAWEKNPFIHLTPQYISAYRINWNNKVDNIKELAKELNIGLDSLVFVDDNPTERELVKQMLPEVEVPEFPLHPYLLPVFFRNLVDKYFRIYSITEEDRTKVDQYHANLERRLEETKFTNLSDFLANLQIELKIQRANKFTLSRIAQMTQKTNQFNLTTIRYNETDLRKIIDDGNEIFSLSVKDKFGDSGITGCIVLKGDNNSIIIDTFLLSCRILGKGIEFAFLYSILNMLKNRDIERVESLYISTKKNIQVADFYDRVGFTLNGENGENKLYHLFLDNKEFKIESYYKIEFE